MDELNRLKSISEWQKEDIGALAKRYAFSTWYFETMKEKAILIILCSLGWWKIFGLIFGWVF